MGSGETAPTMVSTHRRLAARLEPSPGRVRTNVRAAVLDTPYGFQENASELAERAVAYFSESIDVDLDVAGLTRIIGVDDLLGVDGLVRGHTVACRGPAAHSLAVVAAAAAVAMGSWVAVVGVDGLGVEAMADAGLPPERLIRIRVAGDGARSWADLCLAALDGFEVLITCPPARVPAPVATAIRRRLRARGGCLLVVGDPRGLETDVELLSDGPSWRGVGAGTGRLDGRRVEVRATGRRVHRGRAASLSLPGSDGRLHGPETHHPVPLLAAV